MKASDVAAFALVFAWSGSNNAAGIFFVFDGDAGEESAANLVDISAEVCGVTLEWL